MHLILTYPVSSSSSPGSGGLSIDDTTLGSADVMLEVLDVAIACIAICGR